MRGTAILVLVSALAAGPLAAQQGGINQRLAQGQPPKFVPPLCNLNVTNSKVDKARGSVRKAHEAKTPADKAALLADAKMNLNTAIAQEAQGTNAAAWYYLGRIALLEGDPRGADSAFTKAEQLAPTCEIDIMQYRQNNWALLGKAGMEMQAKGQMDSALALFREAAYLFRGLPHVYTNMGVLFATADQHDSAAAYFAKSLEIAEKDTSLVEDRNTLALNLAITYQRASKNLDAITVLHRYLKWKPDDTDAQKQLAMAFRSAGMTDSADAVESGMIARFAASNLDSLDTQDLMAVGVAAFNKAKYSEAERAFGHGAKRNPWSRDAHYNLANTYLAMVNQARDSAEPLRKLAKTTRNPSEAVRAQLADTLRFDGLIRTASEGLVRESAKLLELEPMNEDALRLLANGQRLLAQTDVLLKTAERLVALPFGVEVTLFSMSTTGVRFTADATGRAPTDAAGKPLKTAPMTLQFEFIDATGKPVDTKEVTVPVLASGQKHPILLEAKGAGIIAWRYTVKP